MNNILNALLLLPFLTGTSGCGEKTMRLYKQSDITGIVVESLDYKLIELKYIPILETLYYSPGANFLESVDTINLELVRCSINSKCEVTNKARYEASGQLVLTVEHKGKAVWIVFKDGKLKIYPK
ncbi:MAG: hypothetical protein WCI11_05620 [Candidatus Methylumidiphilus sp.]